MPCRRALSSATNAASTVAAGSLLVCIACSPAPNDKHKSSQSGQDRSVARELGMAENLLADAGYSARQFELVKKRESKPVIARPQSHHPPWSERFEKAPAPGQSDAVERWRTAERPEAGALCPANRRRTGSHHQIRARIPSIFNAG